MKNQTASHRSARARGAEREPPQRDEPTQEQPVDADGPASVEVVLLDEPEPASVDVLLFDEPEPASADVVLLDEPEPASADVVLDEPAPASVDVVLDEPEPASVDVVLDDPAPTSADRVLFDEPAPASRDVMLLGELDLASGDVVLGDPKPASEDPARLDEPESLRSADVLLVGMARRRPQRPLPPPNPQVARRTLEQPLPRPPLRPRIPSTPPDADDADATDSAASALPFEQEPWWMGASSSLLPVVASTTPEADPTGEPGTSAWQQRWLRNRRVAAAALIGASAMAAVVWLGRVGVEQQPGLSVPASFAASDSDRSRQSVKDSSFAVEAEPTEGPRAAQHLAIDTTPSNDSNVESAAPTAPPFDGASAREALRRAGGVARACKRPGFAEELAVVVTVTFAPTGRVTTATVVGGPDVRTAAGRCIVRAFRAARTQAFAGSPVTVRTTVRF